MQNPIVTELLTSYFVWKIKKRCLIVWWTKQWDGIRRQYKQQATSECLLDEIMSVDEYHCPRAKLVLDYVAPTAISRPFPQPNSPSPDRSHRYFVSTVAWLSMHATLFVSANKQIVDFSLHWHSKPKLCIWQLHPSKKTSSTNETFIISTKIQICSRR